VQTFDHLKEQILMLNNEKIKLLMDLKKSKEQQEEQKQVMLKDIKVLKQQLASLKKTT